MNTRNVAGMSSPVGSSQCVPHKKLLRLVKRYRETDYLNSIPNYAQDEFYRVNDLIQNSSDRVILDSGCGTGESTLVLANANPHHIVVGVDKSNKRMRRCCSHGSRPDNVIFVRCDLVHFWRLLRQANWKLAQHYILYPNPWPKPRHVQRRWHAHPVFPAMIKLGGILVMRTNWRIYADEFAMALHDYVATPVSVSQLHVSTAMTAFERKYVRSGHSVYEIRINLSCDRMASLQV